MNPAPIILSDFDKNIVKENIQEIFNKYLDDRKYIEEIIPSWRDAILNDCEKILKQFNNYKFFLIIHLHKRREEKYDSIKTNGFYYGNIIEGAFTVVYKSKYIYSYINIYYFKKIEINKKNSLDFDEILSSIKKEYINTIEGRNYEIVKLKYYETFKRKFFDEILKGIKYNLAYHLEFSNIKFASIYGIKFINNDSLDFFTEINLKTEDSILYLTLAKPR
jgi:hypothetical protein